MKYFNLHTHQYTHQKDSIEVVNQYPHEFDLSIPYYSCGIHPLYIDQNRLESDFEMLYEKLILPGCLAVGECGLDKRSVTTLDLQSVIFEQHIAVAEKLQKPVVIHCVAAFQELLQIKKRLKINVPLVIHGFSKKIELAKQLIDNGFYVSFGKNLLHNPELESVFRRIPNDRFFLETDMVEEGIEQVYALASKYKGVEVDRLQEIISSNFTRVFNLK
jgi:TatD DNase family protein